MVQAVEKPKRHPNLVNRPLKTGVADGQIYPYDYKQNLLMMINFQNQLQALKNASANIMIWSIQFFQSRYRGE